LYAETISFHVSYKGNKACQHVFSHVKVKAFTDVCPQPMSQGSWKSKNCWFCFAVAYNLGWINYCCTFKFKSGAETSQASFSQHAKRQGMLAAQVSMFKCYQPRCSKVSQLLKSRRNFL